MTTPLNISSDDAAFFQASSTPLDTGSSNDDLDDSADTEDPVGRGASKVGQLDMFVAPPVRHRALHRGSRAVPTTDIRLTPGAHLIP